MRTLELKIAFFKFYLSLIGDYLSFFKETEGNVTASKVFDFDKYLESLKPEYKRFMEEVSKTQMFFNFIEKSYAALKQHNELLYFVKGAKRIQNGSGNLLEKDLGMLYAKLIDNYKHVIT
jgi:hypothetical protein